MRTTLILLALALVAGAALAAGPYTVAVADGTGSSFIALVDSTSNARPKDAQLYFGDADVTVSYWDYTTGNGWVRVNNAGNALADSVSTIPAGLVERPDFRFKAIYVTRNVATSGVIKWFQ